MTQEIQLTKLIDSGVQYLSDVVAVEEPLEIQLQLNKPDGYKMHPLSVTMRTPGQDDELAVGFMFTEGIISSRQQLAYPPTYPLGENKILIRFSETTSIDLIKLKRNFYTTSSCGVCGKESIDAIHQVCPIRSDRPDIEVAPETLFSLPERLRDRQQTFKQTGGIHAAALFDSEGTLQNFQEDIGRHNALDKLIGAEFLKTDKQVLDLSEMILLLSGRASFELIQKAAMAGIQIVCAIGAPSSMALETAQSFGMTLIGFLKPHSANIYCGPERVNQPVGENKN
ncbi:MAG: formate dehydrogenase accessory sulfurtransferase FdhD [Cyclobacteriaceae bacterium]